jgi:short-subunit dehydrogenase involved in D-alanine esterification of teichoic acids
MTVASILITGGTSLVGLAIIRQQNNKYPIVAYSRSAKPESSASLVHYGLR